MRNVAVPRKIMRLEKGYFDVVADDGSGAIGYAARAELGGVVLRPAALLEWGAEARAGAVRRRTLRGGEFRRQLAGGSWKCSALGTEFAWDRAPSWREQVLWDGDGVSARWQVLAPSVRMILRDAKGAVKIAGRGYAEVLKIEGNPRRLPVDVLRWGRFVSEARNVTWIEWARAGGGLSWVWNNSGEAVVKNIEMSNEAVTWAGHRLELRHARTLRSGRVGRTVFGALRGMKNLLPAWVNALDETKWLARGRLTGAGGLADEGWVIHETVRFR